MEGEKMKKEKKQLSLNAKIIIACFFMVIVPNILIFCSLMGIKGYFEATMGSAFRDKVDPSILRFFIMDTLISVIVILIICMSIVRKYVYKEIVRPISELNVAMKKIAEGNLDYRMENKYDSEMGEVFNNYEEMRLKLKESTTEMMENEEHNRELVSNISHDLKTPITSIKGYVEGIMDGVADTPEKMDRYIKTIYNKANDMDRLINELTIYSKIDNNRILYNFQRINVSDYFGDCVDEVGLDLESKNIKLNFDNLIPDDTMVIADPEQMKRVINNIIGNSIKYMDKDLTKEQGMIEIRLLDDIDSIRIEIEDNGRGIAARDLGRIFERFYRTDASRNSSRGGSGIGLSIVKKIIEDHGGYIWATSKEGEGTCMHFVLRKYKEVDDDE
ncbi:MAG: HAMP domain-containing histidine kinase [Lachnospiraceae bacterium]|nr:HAMP domain-containing histidine kinase [Lachnospiraceae bacterium]